MRYLLLFDPATVGVCRPAAREGPARGRRAHGARPARHGVWVNGVRVHDGRGYAALERGPAACCGSMPPSLRLYVALNAGFAHRRARTLLAAAGVALGVALGFTLHLVNRAAVDELAAGVRALAGEADLEVRGGREVPTRSTRRSRAPRAWPRRPPLLEAGRCACWGSIRCARPRCTRRSLRSDVPQMRAVLDPGAVLLTEAAAARLHLGTARR